MVHEEIQVVGDIAGKEGRAAEVALIGIVVDGGCRIALLKGGVAQVVAAVSRHPRSMSRGRSGGARVRNMGSHPRSGGDVGGTMLTAWCGSACDAFGRTCCGAGFGIHVLSKAGVEDFR